MQVWQYLLLAAFAAGILLLTIYTAIRKARLRRERDFQRRLETLLLPKETVKVICPGKKGRWILTSSRLILEVGEGFHAFPFSKIKKVSGVDETGKATVSAKKMAILTVKTPERDYSLTPKSAEFPELVKGLKAGVARGKSSKK